MRYDDPVLRERLAAQYVLGTMPSRARRRFERLIAAEPDIARFVADWSARLAPLDDATAPEQPPERLWQAIERQLDLAEPPAAAPSVGDWLAGVAFWRNWALAASGALVALVLYVALGSAPAPAVVAVLADKAGDPGWVATAGPHRGEVSVTAVRPLPADSEHALQLWAIAGGNAPKPLGLLSAQPRHLVTVDARPMLAANTVLAVSLEPPGGSATGQPTGPVLYQGKIFAAPR